jgi:hypothetical protein
MFIVNADRNSVVNMDNVISVYVTGERILAVTKVDDIVIGLYRTDERAQEVYAEMLKEAFPPFTWGFQNCEITPEEYQEFRNIENGVTCVSGPDGKIERYDCGVYYMPEE